MKSGLALQFVQFAAEYYETVHAHSKAAGARMGAAWTLAMTGEFAAALEMCERIG
ncbi:hypothetical protein [Amycolatopsis regifaucium]|uniref:hypothetical protein n=1 Tax=Amycolatopsis regifaucium TaxID=546365 RepID=UPI0008F66D24|nr:hypothetical protein [Amycolatopsis regifaucium]SFI80184.1 hypothetical protein SAMN04489731_113103 [Amycolatopsis regifaucium]